MLARLAVLAAAAAVLPACATPAEQRSTLLRASDLQLSTSAMVRDLSQSPLLAGRGPDAQPSIILRPQPMENRSDTRLSAGDQWAAWALVLTSPGMLDLLRSRNVLVQMPPLETARIARAGLTINEPAATIAPTHLFRATVRSLARAASDSGRGPATARRDLYLFEFTIVDAATRQIVWAGTSEVARLAHGSLVD